MKNSISGLIGLIIIIYCQTPCNAQVINNKLNVYVAYEKGFFHCKETVQDKSFLYPSLFSNLTNVNGISLKVLKNIPHRFNYGVSFLHVKALNWQFSDNSDYSDSEITLQSISPTIQIQILNKYTGAVASNRIKVLLELAPTAGEAKLILAKPLFDIQTADGNTPQPMKSNDFFYGLKGSIGAEFIINQLLGINLQYSMNFNRISSQLYADNHFTASYLSLGTIIKVLKDKRYFY